jgi:hypothetical protein
VANRTLQVPIQRTCSLDEADEAIAAFGAGTRGQLVLTIA